MYAKISGSRPEESRESTAVYALFWTSGVLGCFLDNVSYGMTISGMLKRLQYTLGLPSKNLVYAMILSQQFSCNCCVISFVANLIVAEICAQRNPNHGMTFINFAREGLPITVITMLIATLFLYILN